MVTSTFVFLQGVGPATERRFWKQGLLDWQRFMRQPDIDGLSSDRKSLYDRELTLAQSEFDSGNLHALASRFPRREHWRFYDGCRSDILYLDIETTGLSSHEPTGAVTVVGLYRNGRTTALIQGETLTADRLQTELDHCRLLVTFFGTGFDVPYLRSKFPQLRFDMPHFDLCLAVRRLGFRGGLKHLEQEFGIDRAAPIHGLNGMDAVRLWSQWQRGDRRALDTLLAYNAADTESLVPLSTFVYKELMVRYGPIAVGALPTASFFPALPLS
ncbi:MAG: ribonuclease H-like domain-containing protein [Nitrospira sp.]|nr:ribonuclease H-like domain-containing protein [Nitrospira sp.]